MNKGLTGVLLSVLSSAVILSSCGDDDLISTKQVDNYDGITRKKLESIIHDKLDRDIDIDKDVNVVDLDSDGKLEYVIRYKTQEKDKPLRIMILSEEDDKIVIKDEIKSVGEDFDEISYRDIKNDDKLEIIAGFKAGESLSKGISIYEYKDGKATEIFEEYYSDYIVKDVTGDGEKDLIIIKEKEKEGKSYAYLYKLENNEFKKIKKVEIDPTLDTKDEIIQKMIEE